MGRFGRNSVKRRWFNLVSLALFIGILCIGCERDPLNVVYVVPDGLTGFFWIMRDANGGINATEDAKTVKITIPRTRILRTRDDRFLQLPHRESATWSSGTKLAVVAFDTPKRHERYIHDLGASFDGAGARHTFLI